MGEDTTSSVRITRIKALADVLWELSTDINIDADLFYNAEEGDDCQELLYEAHRSIATAAKNLEWIRQMVEKQEARYEGVYKEDIS